MPAAGTTTTTATRTTPSLTLGEATASYRLHDPNISNPDLAASLGISNGYRTYPCCFFRGGDLVAVRTESDEVAFSLIRRRSKSNGNCQNRCQDPLTTYYVRPRTKATDGLVRRAAFVYREWFCTKGRFVVY